VSSPGPGTHARTDGSVAPEGVPFEGVPEEGVTDEGVPGEGGPVGADDVPKEAVGADDVLPDPLQPTRNPAPAIRRARRPNSPEETMLAVSPASQTRYWVTR